MHILAAVVALIAWTMLIMVLLYIVRIPAMKKAGIDLKNLTGSKPGQLDAILEPKAQWPAHNYMHLVEQPTVFYAVCFALVLLHAGGGYNPMLAWAYVGLRVVHSIVQITTNRIQHRFLLFALSSIVLIALTVQAVRAVIHTGAFL
jgi:hypothetical protein